MHYIVPCDRGRVFFFKTLLFIDIKQAYFQMYATAGIKIIFNKRFLQHVQIFHITVKPVISGYSTIDKTKVLNSSGSLVQLKIITECTTGAFCNTCDLD